MESKMLSYSAMTKFCNCHRAYKFSYIDRIESINKSDALSFGSLIHSSLSTHYDGNSFDDIVKGDDMATAMMAGYLDRYHGADSNMKVLATELPFECDIVNPLTGRKSRKFKLHGFIDMVVDTDGEIWIWEHKTKGQLSVNDIERIRHDFQIMIYAIAYEMMTGKKVTGIVYNILKKTMIRQTKKETTEQFNDRLKELYLTDPSMFHREAILVDELRTNEAKQEIWQISQDIGNTKSYYKNRSQCKGFGMCEFFKICNSGDNPLIIQNYYKERDNDVTNEENREENKSF